MSMPFISMPSYSITNGWPRDHAMLARLDEESAARRADGQLLGYPRPSATCSIAATAIEASPWYVKDEPALHR